MIAVAAAASFSWFADVMGGRRPSYTIWAADLMLAAGIALFASRFCWWVLLLIFVVALGSWALSVVNNPVIVSQASWPSWVNVALQASIPMILVTPAMLSWVKPLPVRGG